MRRWLTIALMLLLPLQFAWAAAAAYCGHEPAPAKPHIGHHVHEHQDEAGDTHAAKASTAKAGKLVADNDCGYCQLSFAKPLLPLTLQFAADAPLPIAIAPNQAFASRGPDHPDRPNWPLA